jgi:4'-phosphopantetheinyl transferase
MLPVASPPARLSAADVARLGVLAHTAGTNQPCRAILTLRTSMQTNKSALPLWARAPSSLSLEPGELDLWRIGLPQPEWIKGHCRQVLAADEAGRAARFRFPADRDRFLVTHGAIRHILAAYLNVSPGAVGFEYGSHGKPEIARNGLNLRFNLSRSADLAIAAIVRGSRIGVDVERVRAGASCMEIAEQYFSAREIAYLQGVPSGQLTDVFFDCWTRKEAYVKACGAGLSVPLNSFEVPFGLLEKAAPLELPAAKSDEIRLGTMYVLPFLSGYKAAVVVEGNEERKIRYWEWTF